MKELDYPYKKCPHCNNELAVESLTSKIIDVENIENGPYGIQARWKELYTCPHCSKQFYIICEH